MNATTGRGLPFQDLIHGLQTYWARQGCVVLQPCDMEVGAGTFHWATTLRSLGPEPWNVAYVQPSRRPADGRYGDNPNRLQQHYQFQVVMKPSPENLQDLFLGSLCAIGIDPLEHDIRFVEDDWESPTLGAWGLGWEVWCDGMEITQFTYFQQVGGHDCRPVPGELTYGPGTPGHVHPERRPFPRHRLERPRRYLWRRSRQGRARTLCLQLRTCRCRGPVATLRGCRKNLLAPDRGRACAACLRSVHQGEPRIQPAGRERRDQRARARRLYRAGPGRLPAPAAPHGSRAGAALPPTEAMAEFLLEILSEEIPARLQRRGAASLRDLLVERLAGHGIGEVSSLTCAAPRRIVVVLRNLPARQPDFTEERKGTARRRPRQGRRGVRPFGRCRRAGTRTTRHGKGRRLVCRDPPHGATCRGNPGRGRAGCHVGACVAPLHALGRP